MVFRATVQAVLVLMVPASEVLEMAIANLKDELRDGITESLPNPDKPFVVETEPSINSIGGVLLHSEGEEPYPTLFSNQAQYDAQRKYSTYEREMSTVVKGCDANICYLLRRDCSKRSVMQHFLEFSIVAELKQSRREVGTGGAPHSIHSEPSQ